MALIQKSKCANSGYFVIVTKSTASIECPDL